MNFETGSRKLSSIYCVFLSMYLVLPVFASHPIQSSKEVNLICYNEKHTWQKIGEQSYDIPRSVVALFETNTDYGQETLKSTTTNIVLRDLLSKADSAFHGKSYDCILAFPAYFPYKERAQAIGLLGPNASNARISTISEIAALGYNHYHLMPDKGKEHEAIKVVLVSSKHYVSATIVEFGYGVVEVHGSVGLQIETKRAEQKQYLEAILRLLKMFSQLPETRNLSYDEIVVTRIGKSSSFSNGLKARLNNRTPVNEYPGLVAKGFLIQSAMFYGSDEASNNLLLVATPHSSLGIILPKDIVSEGGSEGSTNASNSKAARNKLAVYPLEDLESDVFESGEGKGQSTSGRFLEVVPSFTIIPTRKTIEIDLKKEPSHILIAEHVGNSVKTIHRLSWNKAVKISDMDRKFLISFDIDTNMILEVNIENVRTGKQYNLYSFDTPYRSRKKIWQAFRHQNPLFIQDVILTSPDSNGSQCLILTEPPPLLYGKIKEVLSSTFNNSYKGHNVFTQRTGFDGWVKDIVVHLKYGEGSKQRLRDDISELHRNIFGTDYKAGYRLFDIKPWSFATTLKRKNGAPPALTVPANTLNAWFFDNPVGLLERTASQNGFHAFSNSTITLEEIFEARRSGVFYSVEPGLIVLIIDRTKSLNEVKPYLRQFCIDSDAIIGAVGMVNEEDDQLAIVGRERDSSISGMPPLRVETILTIAATKEENLAQSYERNSPLADKTSDPSLVKFLDVEFDDFNAFLRAEFLGRSWLANRKVDWAPILLSHDLMHTEYGNMLNVTDQILKGWSESNNVKYGNFPYAAPFDYPYTDGVMERLREYLEDSPLTYNWNTAGFGSWTQFDRYSIFALHRTGALPVSYIVDDIDFATDEESEQSFLNAEDKYWQFFSDLRDPNLQRAAQYAALHIIFRKYPVKAEREEYKLSEKDYKNRWEALFAETVEALKKAQSSLDMSDLEIESLLASSGCMSSFKFEHLEKWEQDKENFTYTINRYDSDDQSLDKLIGCIVDPQTYVGPILQERNKKVAVFDDQANRFNLRVKRFNKALEECKDEYLKRGRDPFRLYRCSEESFETQRRILEIEDWSLTRQKEEIEELAEKIRSFTNDARELRHVVEVFGDCNNAWEGIVEAQKDHSVGFVKTPSIVVSRQSDQFYGGHNLYGRSLKVIPDKSVGRGRFRYDDELGILRINPADKSNASTATRSLERLRGKYLSGSQSYKQRIDLRIREALNQTVKPVKPMSEALSRKTVTTGGARSLGSGGLNSDRSFVGEKWVELSVKENQNYSRLASDLGAQVIIQKIPSGHRVLQIRSGGIAAIETQSQADFQRAVEFAVTDIAKNLPVKGGKVSVASDGSMTRADMEIFRLAAKARNTPQAAAGGGGNWDNIRNMKTATGGGDPPRGGGGGFFYGKKAFLFGINHGRKSYFRKTMLRTDADWAAAYVTDTKIVSRNKVKGGAVVLTMEVPFKRSSSPGFAQKMLLRFSSFFKRRPNSRDVDTLREVAIRSLEKDKLEHTVLDRIYEIRRAYKDTVGNDANLHIKLVDNQQDFFIVKVFDDRAVGISDES